MTIKEPMYILYADLQWELCELNSDSFITALLKLYKQGLMKPQFYDYTRGKYEQLKEITKEILQKQCSMRTEEHLRHYPDESFEGEYFFEITEKGRKEEAWEIYNEYYSDAGVMGK